MPIISEIVDRCIKAYEDDDFAALTDAEKVVHLASLFHFEVLTGGFMAFYRNPSGERVLETISALEAIEAMDALQSLRESLVFFGDEEQLQIEEHRDSVVLQYWDELRDCEQSFDRQLPEIDQLVETYIRAHFADVAN